MKIDGFQVSADTLRHYKELVKNAYDEDILWYAKADPAVARGLRLKASSVPGLRTRILHKLNKDSEIETTLRALLVMASPLSAATTSLSEGALITIWDALQVVCGSQFLSSCLLDVRESIHEMAAKALSEEAFSDALLTVEEARSRVAELLGDINVPLSPFLGEVEGGGGGGQNADVPPVESADDAELVTLRKQNTELKQQLKEGRTRAQQVKALEKKLEHAGKKSVNAVEELTRARSATREAEAKAETLRKELEHLRAENEKRDEQTDKRITQRVNERLESVINAWLIPLQELEREADACDGDLLNRAQQVVSKQSRIDQHAGNRLRIREQISALQQALISVRQTAACAILPIPELEGIDSELQREIGRLESVIGRLSPDFTPVAARIACRIERAANLEDLQDAREMLGQLEILDVVERHELVRLYQTYNRRMSLVYAQFGPRIVKAAEWDDPVWRLKHAAANAGTIQLLVDGYNALHLAKDLFADDFEDEIPKSRARDHLMGLLQRMFYAHPDCDVRVYWDSSKHSEQRHGSNLREIFSGGEGEHRADKHIIHDLHRAVVTAKASPQILVTDDRELRAQAKHLGAQVMSVVQFSALLEDLA